MLDSLYCLEIVEVQKKLTRKCALTVVYQLKCKLNSSMSQSYYGFDRRRVNGPEWSVPPTYEVDPSAGSSSSMNQQERGNRGPKDIRPICT